MPASLLSLTRHPQRCTDARWCLMFIFRGPVLTKHGLVAEEVCRFQPRQRLILRAGLIKLHYRVFWMLSHSVALNGHWCSGGDIPSLTRQTPKIRCDQLRVSRPCMEREELQRRFDFSRKVNLKKSVSLCGGFVPPGLWRQWCEVQSHSLWWGDTFQPCLCYQEGNISWQSACNEGNKPSSTKSLWNVIYFI